MNIDAARQRLLEGDPDAVLKELVDFYRRADVLHTPQLPRLLDALFPAWKALLHTRLPPQARATPTHRCRKVLLQILNRLPSNDALRPYVPQLLHLLLEVLYRDNEDNALLALKTVFDLHRNYRPGLRSEVQAFLDLVQQMYKNVHVTVRKQFAEAVVTPPSSQAAASPTVSTVATTPTTTAAASAASTVETSGTAPLSVDGAVSTPSTASTAETTSDSAAATTTTTTTTTAEPVVPVKTESAGAPLSIAAVSSASLAAAVDTKADGSAPPQPPSAADGVAATPSTPVPSIASSTVAVDEPLWSSMESFKAISELPLIIMLLFQCYPTFIESHVPVLVPLMMNLLSLRAPDSAPRQHPQRYVDFLDCQVKTLSFVTYLLRGCATLMRPFQDAICESTVKLLTVCPKDAFVLRKDIFVAARHIISTEFRRGFYAQLELLMDDDVLIGKGRCSFHQIRPLAYSTLADMIHHVRDMLTLSQVSHIVDFYGKRIHDATLPISIQTTSIRLLLNLVDISAKNDDADGWKGRTILSRILLIIASKFGSTLASLPVAIGLSLRSAADRGGAGAAPTADLLDAGAMDKIRQSTLLPKAVVDKAPHEKKLDALLAPYLNAVPRSASGSVDSFLADEEPCIRDVKSLLRTMILGVRAVIWCTANYRNPHAKDLTSMDANASHVSGSDISAALQGTATESSGGIASRPSSAGSTNADATSAAHAYPLTDDERKLISRVLQNGLRCFILYTLSENTLAEEKQMLDHFAGAFTVLDAPDFRDLFLANMELLYECILQDHAILTVPQHFLANSNVSCWFAEILLKFLITQMKDLSVAAEGDVPDMKREHKVLEMDSLRFERMRVVKQEHRASIVLRLFKIVFGSVTLFKSNESALFPHLRTIIESCLKEATFTKHPDNYLLLLRALFRSISGGKYENFYKEVFPLLPGILSALMRLQQHIQKPSMHEVLLELCLTIPARLSSLLQYLPSLMKSVVRAILSRGELAYLGLRTLEFWVDNLNPDFLYPIMTSQDRLLTEIIEALDTHLLPPPYPYGELSMRILGKIGGRNRQYQMDPLELAFESEPQRRALVMEFAWRGLDVNKKPVALGLHMDVLLRRAAAILHRYHRKAPHEWEHVVRKDARLSDSDEYDDHANTAGATAGGAVVEASLAASAGGGLAASSLLLEKDDKTLELERQAAANVKQTILQYKRYAFDVVASATTIAMQLSEAEEPDEDEDEENDEEEEEDDAMNGAETSTRPSVVWESELPTRQLLLKTLFETMDDIDFGEAATRLLMRTATQMTKNVSDVCDRHEPNFAALSTLQPSSLLPGNRGLSPGRHLATAKRIEVLRQASYGTPFVVVPHSRAAAFFQAFASAILGGLSSPNSQVVGGAKKVLERVVETALHHYEADIDAASATYKGGALFLTLTDVFAHACFDKSSWRVKLGGVTGLRLLVDLLAAPFCHENELVIVKALFFVLSDHPSEVSATVSVETGEALLAVVDKARDVRGLDIEAFSSGAIKRGDFMSCTAFQETEIFQMFVVEFLSPKAAARRCARQCIARVAAFTGTTESAMLFPYQQLISKQITGCPLRSLSSATRIGYIDAMAHALSIQPTIFPLTKELMTFLQDVWRLISDDATPSATEAATTAAPGIAGGATSTSSNVPVSAQEYPFGLSQASELRIAAVKLFRAAFLAAPDDMNQHHEARNRFVGVFFRYLTRQPLELVTCAQQALSDVIQLNKQHKEITLPKELLQQCLRPVLLNLADYRKLNLPLLDGLSRLLTLLSSCFNVTLGEKLLEHLKQWRDPDRIMKAGIWKRGDEPAVAAAIVDLFHLLPPNESFLESLVDCVVELEAVLPQYGSYGKMSSPYRLPLTRFLNRYASTSIAFFLKRDKLIEPKYSSLFQELLKLPEALPLRNILLSETGAESLMAATFVAASKTSSLASAAATIESAAKTSATTATPTSMGVGMDVVVGASEDIKMQAQIQLNAHKAAAQAVANAQAQGLSPSAAEARGMQARAAYVAKATAQVNAQQALKVQSQVQIQANAQKLHAQTLAAAQAQGLSLVQAQAKAQFASKDYIAKAQSQVAASTALPSPISSSAVTPSPGNTASPHHVTQLQAQQLHAQIQVNAQKVHAQALAAAHAQGLKPIQAQEKAKQAQATYVHRAKAQAQAKIARAAQTSSLSSALPTTPSALSTVAPFTSKAQQEALELLYQGLRLVRTISKLHATWLATPHAAVLVDCLRKLWRSPSRVQRLLAQERLQIRFHYESKLLVKVLVTYCRAKPDDVQVLLDLLSAFVHRSSSFDNSVLQLFYQQHVAHAYSPYNKRQIVRLFLRMLRDSATPDELKVHAMQVLIMPVLTASFDDPAVNNTDMLDADTVQWMLREILASKDTPTGSLPPSDAVLTLRIELLKLGTLLIQHMSKYVTEHRKEVIKFAWNHLKAHDLTSKLWAYVNVCRFISVYDTPPKIVLQVYVALLRTHEMDARFLVRKAFDILLPALPSRLPPNEFIKAIKWTKKIAYEEGHQLGQLVHIWFLIVRHPALFYPFRGQFVPLMVNSLNRLAIPPSSTPDNRRLAVNIVDLIIAWEHTRRERVASRPVTPAAAGDGATLKRRALQAAAGEEETKSESESPSQKRRKVMSGTSEDASAVAVAANGSVAASSPTAKTAAAAYSEDDFELNAPMIDLVLNFAFRFALASADKQETSRLSKTCGELFDKALRLWPSASVRFSYFDKLIAVTAEAILRQQPLPTSTPPTQSMPTFFAVPKGAPLSSLAILDAVLGILNALITPEVVSHSARPVPYVVQYAPRVMKLLEPCFDRANGDIQTGLTTFLRRMVELYPPGRAVSQELIACKFYPWLQEIVADRLQSAVALQQEFLTSLPSHAASSAVASGSSGGGATQKTKNKQGGGSTAATATASGVSSPANVKSEPKAGQTSPGTAAAAGSPAKRQKTAGSDAAVTLKVKAALAAAQSARSSGIPPSVFAGETALRLLASLCEGAPAFADPFAPTLLKLAQFFTREHLLHAAASAAASVATTSPNTANRIGGGGVAGGGAGGGAGGAALSQDTASLSDSMTRHRVMATPSLAITEEWQLMLTGRSTLSVNNVVRHLKKKEPGDKHKKKSSHGEKESAGFAAGTKAGSTASSSGVKKKGVAAQHVSAANGNGTNTAASVSSSSSAAASGLLSHKMAVELLIVTLRLLSKCSLPSADHRRVYTNLLIHCLESSTNVPLLLEITRIAGAAITTAPPQTATTATPNWIAAKDKMTLLTKMSSFERLHEVAARPLYDEYYRLVLKLCDPSSDVKHSYFHITPSLPQSHSLTTHFVAGLLAPDAEIREQFLKYLYEAAASGSPDAAEDSLPTARLLLVLRQDWQACGSRYWIAVAVETLLSAATNSTPTGSPRANSKRRLSGQLSPTSPSPSSQLDLLRALRYLAHVDVEIAEELWIQLFRETWQQLSTPQQAHVSSQLVKTFSSKFNKRDLYVPLLHSSPPRGRVNVVQTLLRSLVAVTPTAPVLTPELVLHLAGAYDAWSSAMRLCEFQVENASLRVESRLRWIEALSSIYKTLSDDDLRVGLSLEHIAQPETRAALVLESLGCVHEAQEEYFKALSKAQSGRVSMDDVNLFELRLWEERWVACAKQLCQWQLMHDFAKATQNQDLLLDCVWKRGDWHGAKQLLNVSMGATGPSSAAGSSTQAGAGAAVDLGGACPHTRLQRLYIAILDSEKRASIDTLAAQTAELALFQWQGLPRVLGKSHVALLHLFHQFVEVKESIQMMYDIKHASQLHTLPNLKPSINTWRERLPNKWEPILMWDDILTWRSHMFQVVKNTFSWSDAQMLACMHDSPWSVIRLAHTARKQHLPDVCLGALSKLYTIPAMDVQDAFSKLREQVSICYESASEYTGGLAILNNTNLDYFSLRQKAEMFRLKALFLEAMGNSTDANQTFSHCLQICDSYGKGWLSWGHYCYRLFVASSGRGGHGRELSFASQTIACYLQAIHHRCNAARLMIARVLWLLSMDDPHRGVLIQAFEAHGKQLPIWIWIVWIPQLLMALGRPEAPQIRGLLRGLSAKFPQALYYTMRAFFLENRDSSMAAQQQQMSGQGQMSGSAPTTPQSSGNTGAATTVTASTGGPGTPTFSGTPVYYRTKTGQVVAVPSTMPLNHVQQIPGLVAPARPTPSAFGVALSQVMTVDAWRERLLLGSGGADGASSQATSSSSSSSSSSAASSSMPTKPELGPVQYTEDLLNFLRRTHDSLTFEMECVLEEMITKFRPEPEEELLTAVHSLLLKCYQLPRLSQREPVPRMLRAALEKVCRKLFAVTAASSTTGSAVGAPPPPQQHKNEKYVEFVTEFKAAFEADFAPDASLLSAPIQEERVTLFEMMDRLKKWRNLLQARVQHQSCGYSTGRASTLRLEHCSRFLMELSSSNMEVPGQYIADREPIKDLHARIQHFDNDVDVLLRSGYTQRRLTMGGSDGATYSFLVQYAMTHTTRTDERMAQMYLLLNRLLARHKETRKRNAVFHVPRVVPLTPRVRLLEDSRDVVTLGEIYDQSCRASDTDPDLPMELYRERISEAYAAMAMAAQHDASETMSPQQEDEQLALAKARAFDEVCASHVPETLLAKYIFERSAHADAYFEFRSEFTKHLALSSLLAYVLFVGDRAPHRILFSRRTARVVSAELRPGYASSGLLEASTSMPFRLTRNLHNFVTRPGVHGPFSVVMAATAEALMGEEELLGNQLGLFFRDDLLSWHASKTRLAATASSAGMADSASQQQQQQRQRRLESQVQQRVDANVSLVLERIRGVSLKKETDSQRGKSVRELLEIATSPERQREMYPTWCPWL